MTDDETVDLLPLPDEFRAMAQTGLYYAVESPGDTRTLTDSFDVHGDYAVTRQVGNPSFVILQTRLLVA